MSENAFVAVKETCFLLTQVGYGRTRSGAVGDFLLNQNFFNSKKLFETSAALASYAAPRVKC